MFVFNIGLLKFLQGWFGRKRHQSVLRDHLDSHGVLDHKQHQLQREVVRLNHKVHYYLLHQVLIMDILKNACSQLRAVLSNYT